MDFDTCHDILGVVPGASLRQIHAAYKQLALKHHPDRAPDDPEAHEVFIRVTEAYSILKNAFYEGRTQRARPRRLTRCDRCHAYNDVHKGLDGGRYCVDCLLNRRRRFLPLPSIEVIRCLGVFALDSAAVLLLIRACLTGQRSLFISAGAAAIAGIGLMAYHVWSADEIKK